MVVTMEEEVEIICSYCSTKLYLSIPTLEEKIREAKIGRVGRVAHQLSAKHGPYYDRWKAAMEARGEQKRCRDCKGYDAPGVRPVWYSQTCKERGHKLGEFACRRFRPKEETR